MQIRLCLATEMISRLADEPEAQGCVGIFMNGEAILPHAPHYQQRPDRAFPLEGILDAIVEIASHHGSDVRDRVMVRNWSDHYLSDESSPFIGSLQRRLVLLDHVPVDSDAAPSKDNEYNRSTVEELDGAVSRRAANWAARMLGEEPNRPVTVVAVGLRLKPDLPTAVNLVPVSFYWNAPVTSVDVDDVKGLAPRIRVGRKLW